MNYLVTPLGGQVYGTRKHCRAYKRGHGMRAQQRERYHAPFVSPNPLIALLWALWVGHKLRRSCLNPTTYEHDSLLREDDAAITYH